MGLAAATLALLGLAHCGSDGRSSPPPNILLIVVDTLRADRLGSYGNQRGLTPFLDELAAGAAVFRNAYATSSWTNPSVASLLTSRYPSQHGVISFATALDPREVTLAEVLAQAGYRTAAFMTNGLVTERGGFAQGFELFTNVTDAASPFKPRAASVRQRSLAWLDGVREQSAAPVFLYLHFMEPHWPYSAPPPFRDRFLVPDHDLDADMAKIGRKIPTQFKAQFTTGDSHGAQLFTEREAALLASQYDAEVASLDAELDTLFAELDKRDFLGNSIVVFTADHGEELLDHGNLFHAYTLYNESIRVPLIVRLPGQRHGSVVEEAVSLLDVAPSVVELLNLPIPNVFEGYSFARLLTRPVWLPPSVDRILPWGSKERPPIVAQIERDASIEKLRRLHSTAIIQQSAKLLTRPNGTLEFYDLAADPRELDGNGNAGSERAQRLSVTLQGMESALTARAALPAATFELDEATRERLKALGYATNRGGS